MTLTGRLGRCHLIFPLAYSLFAGRNSGTLADPEASRTGCRMAGRGRNRAAQRQQYQSPQAQMSRVSRAGVLAAYRDGVTVICELAAQFSDDSADNAKEYECLAFLEIRQWIPE